MQETGFIMRSLNHTEVSYFKSIDCLPQAPSPLSNLQPQHNHPCSWDSNCALGQIPLWKVLNGAGAGLTPVAASARFAAGKEEQNLVPRDQSFPWITVGHPYSGI